jgi:hypothetical protein
MKLGTLITISEQLQFAIERLEKFIVYIVGTLFITTIALKFIQSQTDYLFFILQILQLVSEILSAFYIVVKILKWGIGWYLDHHRMAEGFDPIALAKIVCPQNEKKDYNGFYIRPFDFSKRKEETQLAASLGNRGFGDFSKYSLEQRYKFYNRWISQNKDIFFFICFNNTVIGYICILPMKNSFNGVSHYKGQISQFEMSEKHIVPYGSTTKRIYIQAIYVDKNYRGNSDLQEAYYTFFCKKCSELMESPKGLIIYAEKFTKEGRKLLEGLGFSYGEKISIDKHQIFELNFSRKNAGYRSSITIDKIIEFFNYRNSLEQSPA